MADSILEEMERRGRGLGQERQGQSVAALGYSRKKGVSPLCYLTARRISNLGPRWKKTREPASVGVTSNPKIHASILLAKGV